MDWILGEGMIGRERRAFGWEGREGLPSWSRIDFVSTIQTDNDRQKSKDLIGMVVVERKNGAEGLSTCKIYYKAEDY